MARIRRVGALRARIVDADLALFRGLAGNRWAILDSSLPRLTRAADNSKLWISIAVLLWASGKRSARRGALRGLLSVGVTSALVNGPLKWLGRRARPDILVVPEERRILRIPKTTSFPSGHSASAFAFATGATIELGLPAAPLYALASSVALSRVYTGAHYPSDVIAGSLFGAAVAGGSLRPWPTTRVIVPTARSMRLSEKTRPSQDGEGLAIVANKASGSSIGPDPLAELRAEFPKAVIEEVGAGDEIAKALLRLSPTAKALGVCGGDGSVNAAASVALDTDKPLLIVPTGTLNNLAQAIGIEHTKDAIAAARSGTALGVDVAAIDGRAFLNTASFGDYVELVDAREKLESTIGKWPAVLVALVQVLRHSRPVAVEVDGKRAEVWMAFIGNCRYYPEGFAPKERARLDEGTIDFRYVDATKRLARLRLVAAVLTGSLNRSRVYRQAVVSSLHIRSLEGPLRLARDGETFEGSEEITVEKLATLPVLAPPHKPA